MAEPRRKRQKNRKRNYTQEKDWLWENMRERNCHYCGVGLARGPGRWNSFTLDHRKPLGGGGYNKRANYVAACARCNSRKGRMSYEAFVAAISEAKAERSLP